MEELVVRRSIKATPERLFDAWTDPGQLVKWWGPEGVECPEAQVDLRVGGAYRIANRLPDGTILWIAGEFEVIERPAHLAYTWRVGEQKESERVTVSFQKKGKGTEVVVRHERIATKAAKHQHGAGWVGCLHGLAEFAAA